MQYLLDRLRFVEENCGGGFQIENDNAKLSEFDREKKRILKSLKEVRKKLRERDSITGNNVAVVRLSSEVRTACKQLAKDIAGLRGKITELEIEEEQQYRAGMVVMCEGSLQQLIREEKGIHEDEDLEKLLERTVASLPEIDDERFLKLKREDQAMQAKLSRIEEGVQSLKALAEELGKETDKQTAQIEELDMKVDEENERLDTLSERLEFALKSTRGRAMFSMYAILLALLLAIVLHIYNIVQ